MQNRFNVSVAEVAFQDVHHRARVGFAMVGNDQRVVNAKMDKLINLVEEIGMAEMIDTEMEIIHL